VRRQAAWSVGVLVVLEVMLGSSGIAAAAEPVPFATESAPCSNNEIVFPIQVTSHPDAIFHFTSIGAEGTIGQYSTPHELVAAAVLLAAIPVFILYLVLHRQFEQGVAEGAVKQ